MQEGLAVPHHATGLRIGLTGGIGSGKTTVARLFASLGARVVDLDEIARELTSPGGKAMPALVEVWGEAIMTSEGSLNRPMMRQWAFENPSIKAQLEAILHPLITQEAQYQMRAAGAQVVVVDIPLLAESAHWRACLDRILVVDCAVSTQVQRVRERSGWPDEQIRQVIQQQSTRQQRLTIADDVIWNQGISQQDLQVLVEKIWNHWLSL